MRYDSPLYLTLRYCTVVIPLEGVLVFRFDKRKSEVN